jgi:hypothetical protein
MTKLLNTEARGEAAGVNSPKQMHHPAWAVFPAEAGMRGTQTTARAVRYPLSRGRAGPFLRHPGESRDLIALLEEGRFQLSLE